MGFRGLRPQDTQQPSDPDFVPTAAMQPAEQKQVPMMVPITSPYQRAAFQQAATTMSVGGIPETSLQRVVYDPRAQKQMEQAKALEAGAVAAQARASEQESAIRAAGYEKIGQEVEQRMGEYQKAVDEFKKAKVVDPRSEWGTEQKIGAAISMALGAFAATYSGGRNYAADIIESSIKRDLDMQEARINKLGIDAKQADGALAQAYRKFGDLAQARSAVEMAAIAKVGDDIMARAQKSDNEKVKANAQTALAALKQKEANIASEQQKMIVSTTGKAPTVGAGQELMTEYGRAPSTQAANVIREKSMGIKESQMSLTDAKNYMQKYGSFEIMPGASKGEYEGVLVGVKSTYQKLMNLGVLNPSEDAKMDQLIRNKLSKAEALAFVGGLEKKLVNQEEALVQAYIPGAKTQRGAMEQKKQVYGFQQ